MRKIVWAFLPTGKGFRSRYGYIGGGSSISTKQHNVWFDPEENAIALDWGKDPEKRVYISKDVFQGWEYEKSEGKPQVIPENEPCTVPKKKPGRPKGSKNKPRK